MTTFEITGSDRIPAKHLPPFVREVSGPTVALFPGLADEFLTMADRLEADPGDAEALEFLRAAGVDDLNNESNAQAYAMWVAGGGLEK
ncbi:MAG TPA: hypothetical protein VFY84_19275 [Jiangellales bacterium]|nr:hypothetical protein [Jiangellales bacterium]